MEFKQVLRARRKAMGLTQREVGDWLHIRDVNISDYEKGKALPETKRLDVLARKLKLSISELMGDIAEDDPRLQAPSVDAVYQHTDATGKNTLTVLEAKSATSSSANEMALVWVNPWELALLTRCRLTDDEGRDAIMSSAELTKIKSIFGLGSNQTK